ncbi:MAG TPA: hypothetical protein VHT74_16570 [Acetobacteraceae bacterium]|jgi:hypothetical protein|nr:hypothetical protein [Acetobacteraceae bacterium]
MANQDHPNTHQAEAKAPPAPKPDPKAVAAAKEAQAAGSIGAQVILDFNGDGSLGARGGLSSIIEENTAGRDAHYIALGLNPLAPSGPPPSMEQRKAHQAAAEAQAKVDAAHATPGSGAASRVSSLAAGLITEPADVPVAPPEPPASTRGGSH